MYIVWVCRNFPLSIICSIRNLGRDPEQNALGCPITDGFLDSKLSVYNIFKYPFDTFYNKIIMTINKNVVEIC